MVDPVALLERAPEPLRRLAARVAVGHGLLGRLADRVRFRFAPTDIPTPPTVATAPVRMVLGPVNSAGQGFLWARAVERVLPGTSALAVYGIGADPWRPDADLRIPVAVYQRSEVWNTAFEAFLMRQTHVVWESGLPLLGRRYGSDTGREIARLAESGVRGALMFHGSDIRPPAGHAARNPWSPFRDPSGPIRAIADTARMNARLVARAGVPTFVSTPDLLEWLPSATWCPVVVDPRRWAAGGRSERTPGPPVVAHAPSQRWLKGTDRIEPVLWRLHAQGVIDYRPAAGIPHAAMPAFLSEADIVLDQFALGSYGVAACEALAGGRLVIGHVDASTRARVRDATGLELPVHEATIESLEGELRRAAAEPEAFAAVRAAGPQFVEAVHDGRRSALALAPFLGVSA